MKIKTLVYAVCIFAIVLVQSTLLDYLRVFNVKPDLLVVFTISVALLRGNTEGAAVGFFCGLMHDIVTGKILGFHALLGLYMGLVIGSLNRRLYRENFFVIIFFTFVASVAYGLAAFILNAFFTGEADILFSLRSIVLPEAVYNSVVSFLMYIFVFRLNDRFQAIDKVSRKY